MPNSETLYLYIDDVERLGSAMLLLCNTVGFLHVSRAEKMDLDPVKVARIFPFSARTVRQEDSLRIYVCA